MTVNRIQLSTCLALLLLVGLGVARSAGEDMVVDAKRKVVAELIKGGKLQEATGLAEELAKAPTAGYKDYLQLARIYDKNGRAADTAEQYRKVLRSIGPRAGDEDQRTARNEADRRLKQLDPQSPKIDTAVDELLKKLDVIRREAEAVGNQAALARADAIREALLKVDARGALGTIDVTATDSWQPSGVTVVAGATYRVRATGRWRMIVSNPTTECDADGLSNWPKLGIGNRGALLGSIDRKAPFVLGRDAQFTASANGLLYFTSNDEENGRGDNKGVLHVVIEPGS